MKFCLYLAIFLSSLLFAQEERRPYAWPLTIDNGFSSGFQEFRPNHFHAGIDLRTFQQTGFPVLAVADGDIFQIKVVKNDTGRALYLRMKDGRTAVYYHLDRYNDEIEKRVARIRRERGQKYFGDYRFEKPLAVKMGDLIALSGETGAGFAHLHLEIRDDRGYALNPFPLIRFPGRDLAPPVIAGILVRSRGHLLVNGRSGEFYLPVTRNGGVAVIREPLIIHGPLDFTVNAHDIADTGKVIAPGEVEAFLDDRPVFRIAFDRFSRDDNNQLGMVYDMFHSNPGLYFFNLFRQTGYGLERSNTDPAPEFASLAEGRHSLDIRVRDQFQNEARAVVPLIRLRQPLVDAEAFLRSSGEIWLRFDRLVIDPESRLDFSLCGEGNRVRHIGSLDARKAIEAKSVLLRFPADAPRRFLEMSALHEGQPYFRKRWLFPETGFTVPADVVYSIYAHRDELVIRLSDFPMPAACVRLKVMQDESSMEIAAREEREGIGFSFKPFNRQSPVQLKFIFLNRGTPVGEIQKTENIVLLKDSTAQTFRLGNFSAEFAPRSVYEPKALVVRREALTEEAAGFPVIEPAVSLSPFEFPFLDTVYFGFRHAEPMTRPEQVGVFRYNFQSRSWHSVRTLVEGQNGYFFKTRVICPGVFALLRDIYPPEISLSRLGSRFRKHLKTLVIKIRDKGKGVDENSLKVELNGKRVDCEYDSDWSHVKIESPQGVFAGSNRLRVEISDLAQNRTERIFYLRLK